jgi:drug/metabolite transporter (DMT)-like permease
MLEFVLLAAIWGGSYLCMRIASPEFGPVALVEFRVLVAAMLLVPIMLYNKQLPQFKSKLRELGVLGVLSMSIPFCLISFATLHLTAGFAALLNATSPVFTMIVAWVWLKQKATVLSIAGTITSFIGLLLLVLGRGPLTFSDDTLAIASILLACMFYGFTANYTRVHFAGVSPTTVAAGSQLMAAITMLIPALLYFPKSMPSTNAWISAIILAVVSSALAHLLFFRLITTIGPTRTVGVTFLIPVFAMFWGALILNEPITSEMVIGACLISLGTALANNMLPLPFVKRN